MTLSVERTSVLLYPSLLLSVVDSLVTSFVNIPSCALLLQRMYKRQYMFIVAGIIQLLTE